MSRRRRQFLGPGPGPVRPSSLGGGGGGSAPSLTLPYTYNVSDWGGGVSTTEKEGWSQGATDYYWAFTTQNAYLNDHYGYHPTGTTHYLDRGDSPDRAMVYTFPGGKQIDPSLTKLRWAFCARMPSGVPPNFMWGGPVSGVLADGAGWPQNLLYVGYSPAYNPDRGWAYAVTNGTSEGDSPYCDGNPNLNEVGRWTWLRGEIDYVAGTIDMWAVTAETAAVQGHIQASLGTVATTLGHVPEGMDGMRMWSYQGGAYWRILAFWLGTGDDAWPTTSIGSTTEDYS